MIFGKGECRRTGRTSNENLIKSAKIAAFWQDSFYSCLASQSADIKTAERFFTRSAARILCAVYRIRIGKFFVSVINPYCCKRVGVAAVIYGFEFIATVKRAGVNMR